MAKVICNSEQDPLLIGIFCANLFKLGGYNRMPLMEKERRGYVEEAKRWL
jgi:hypothetical protein